MRKRRVAKARIEQTMATCAFIDIHQYCSSFCRYLLIVSARVKAGENVKWLFAACLLSLACLLAAAASSGHERRLAPEAAPFDRRVWCIQLTETALQSNGGFLLPSSAAVFCVGHGGGEKAPFPRPSSRPARAAYNGILVQTAAACRDVFETSGMTALFCQRLLFRLGHLLLYMKP